MTELVFQLYSTGHTPLADALPIIADAGFTAVEACSSNLTDPNSLQYLLQQHGLRLASLHVERKQLKQNMDQTLELANQFNVNHIVCPSLPLADRPANKPGWLAFAAELADYTAQIASTGRDFAWHNHEYEMIRQTDDCMPIRVLLDAVPDMYWQIDIGWITVAGQDPAAWLRTYPDRIKAVHVKDVAVAGECEDENGWADVGYGLVHWNELLEELSRTDCEYLIAEHNNPSDLQRFATRSIRTMHNWF